MIRLTQEEVVVRQYITRHFLVSGVAPLAHEIASGCNISESHVVKILRLLAEHHALVLHPHEPTIWIAHPFSSAPSAVWVEGLDCKPGWWSNCPWCSLGVAALSRRNVRIHAQSAGEGKQLTIDVVNGVLSNKHLLVHLPISVPHMWDNVVYTCSMILFFESEEEILAWCHRHQKSPGGILTISQMWEIAREWYGRFLDPDWNRMSPEEVRQFFASHGLGLDFKPLR